MIGPAPKGYQITEFLQAHAAHDQAQKEYEAARAKVEEAYKQCEAAKMALAKAYNFDVAWGPINITVPDQGKVIRLSSRTCRRNEKPEVVAVIEKLV